MNTVVDNQMDKLPPSFVQAGVSDNPPARAVSLAAAASAVLYPLIIIGAEAVVIFIGAMAGAILYAVLLFGLTNLSYFSRAPLVRRMYLAFLLAPLLRFLSLVMPVPPVAPSFWGYVMIGIPLLSATLLVLYANGLPSLKLRLTWKQWFCQLMFGLSGIPLGVIAYTTLAHPPVIIDSPNWIWIIPLGLVLTLAGAATEEIIFRGLVQKAFSSSFGLLSPLFSSILYASLSLSSLSPDFILYYGLTGLLFAIWVQLSDSLWGSIMANSLMNIVFLLLFYFI